MHHVLAIINHGSTFVFVAVNAMRQGFFSIVSPLSLITQAFFLELQAFFSELHALNSERRTFFSELQAQNSERRTFFSELQAQNLKCRAFFFIRRVRRLGNLNFAENRLLFHSTNLFCVWT